MLLLLRFLRVVFFALIARRRGILEPSELHFRVWPNDIDMNMHLNDGRYVSIMGLGRADLLARSGLLRKALKKRWAPVVGGLMIRYRKEVRTFARFTLRSHIVGWDERWVYIEHVVESGGKTCAIAFARAVLRDRDGAVPTEKVLALLGSSEPSPPLPEAITKWLVLEA